MSFELVFSFHGVLYCQKNWKSAWILLSQSQNNIRCCCRNLRWIQNRRTLTLTIQLPALPLGIDPWVMWPFWGDTATPPPPTKGGYWLTIKLGSSYAATGLTSSSSATSLSTSHLSTYPQEKVSWTSFSTKLIGVFFRSFLNFRSFLIFRPFLNFCSFLNFHSFLNFRSFWTFILFWTSVHFWTLSGYIKSLHPHQWIDLAVVWTHCGWRTTNRNENRTGRLLPGWFNCNSWY